MKQSGSPEGFQNELFALVSGLIAVDGLRFNIYMPSIDLNEEVASDKDVDSMVRDYVKNFWLYDPMHPSNFEDTDTVVITNSILMSDFAWQKTQIFKEFFRPNGFFHNADVFFRQQDRIIAVLTLLRKDAIRRFSDTEVELLKKIQPFVQYSLNETYLPKRIHNRSSLAEKYGLTARELDVIELALTGASNKILVRQLKISLPTLRTHLQNIYSKVDVHSNSELISKLFGILTV